MHSPTFVCTQGCGSRSTVALIPEAERAEHDAFHARINAAATAPSED